MEDFRSSKEICAVFLRFFDTLPSTVKTINTGRGEDDFRETWLAEWESGEKYVIKLAENDFTFSEKIKTWQRCAEEYKQLGYYCPAILPAKDGTFPTLSYKNRQCTVYAEEFVPYRCVSDRFTEGGGGTLPRQYWDDVCRMTARAAAQNFDFCSYPSGYCLFETFCPSDETDEVMENALDWYGYASSLPAEFQPQIQRIWQRWNENRRELEVIYSHLPTSVFQADLNPTNILMDENDRFIGVFDFNLCGRDVFLNYFFREFHWQMSENDLLHLLKTAGSVYRFSDIEKHAAPLLYRCLVPLWYTAAARLKKAGGNTEAIQACLDETEILQTKEIDFAAYMN